jgi:hypothetical protein
LEVLQGRSRMPPDIQRTVLLAPSEDNESTLARPKQKPAPAPAPAPARKPDFFDTTATTIDNDVDELIIGEHVEKSEAGPSEMPRRSARLSSPKNTRLSPSVDPDELQVAVSFLFLSFWLPLLEYRILVYPPDAPGAVNITNADLKRLKPGEFLNDTLIEFGLKLDTSSIPHKKLCLWSCQIVVERITIERTFVRRVHSCLQFIFLQETQ